MMDRLRGKNAQLIEGEFEQWDAELIRLAESCSGIVERNRLRDGTVMEIGDWEIMKLYLDVPKEYHSVAEKLFAKLKVAREIMERLRRENN
jgi:hypothetical protein